MDKSIELLVATRARAAQEAGGFLPSYLIWSGSALLLCALHPACPAKASPEYYSLLTLLGARSTLASRSVSLVTTYCSPY